MEGVFLEVPQFIPSVHKLTNTNDDICFCHISSNFWGETESLSINKSLCILPSIVFPNCFCDSEPPSVSLDYDFFGLVSWLLCIKVYHYNSHIRIIIKPRQATLPLSQLSIMQK